MPTHHHHHHHAPPPQLSQRRQISSLFDFKTQRSDRMLNWTERCFIQVYQVVEIIIIILLLPTSALSKESKFFPIYWIFLNPEIWQVKSYRKEFHPSVPSHPHHHNHHQLSQRSPISSLFVNWMFILNPEIRQDVNGVSDMFKIKRIWFAQTTGWRNLLADHPASQIDMTRRACEIKPASVCMV